MTEQERRDTAMSAECTLDGVTAKISGRLLNYAIIRANPNLSTTFSWPAVHRILANGGQFES